MGTDYRIIKVMKMKTGIIPFLKKKAPAVFIVIALGIYIFLARNPGSCRPCADIVKALGFSASFTSAQARAPEPDGAPARAPEWELRDIEGNTVSSEEFEGKVVLIDFWATWCPPCQKMIPEMIKLQEEYRDEGFAIVGISLDEGGPEKVRAFNERLKVNYTTAMGTDEVIRAFGGIFGLPTSFLIDREGRIVRKHVGYTPVSRIEEEIRPLL